MLSPLCELNVLVETPPNSLKEILTAPVLPLTEVTLSVGLFSSYQFAKVEYGSPFKINVLDKSFLIQISPVSAWLSLSISS